MMIFSFIAVFCLSLAACCCSMSMRCLSVSHPVTVRSVLTDVTDISKKSARFGEMVQKLERVVPKRSRRSLGRATTPDPRGLSLRCGNQSLLRRESSGQSCSALLWLPVALLQPLHCVCRCIGVGTWFPTFGWVGELPRWQQFSPQPSEVLDFLIICVKPASAWIRQQRAPRSGVAYTQPAPQR